MSSANNRVSIRFHTWFRTESKIKRLLLGQEISNKRVYKLQCVFNMKQSKGAWRTVSKQSNFTSLLAR